MRLRPFVLCYFATSGRFLSTTLDSLRRLKVTQDTRRFRRPPPSHFRTAILQNEQCDRTCSMFSQCEVPAHPVSSSWPKHQRDMQKKDKYVSSVAILIRTDVIPLSAIRIPTSNFPLFVVSVCHVPFLLTSHIRRCPSLRLMLLPESFRPKCFFP